MEILSLDPGTYYQDILSDGTRSVLRKNFPTLKRVSFDKRPPVVQTLKITIESLEDAIYAEPSPTPGQSEMIDLKEIIETGEDWFKAAKLYLPDG